MLTRKQEPIMKKCLLSFVAAGVLLAFRYDLGRRFRFGKGQGDAGQQKPAELDRTIKVKMKYLIYLPKDYDQKALVAGAALSARIRGAGRQPGPR